MTPVAIKKYLLSRKLATLQEIATHFRMETNTVVPMLDLWVFKGKVKKHASPGCRKGCCHCDPASLESYEWLN
jgi:putative ferrous iron transport protein C